MITKEQIDAWFADKEKLLVEAVSRLVSIDSVEGRPAPQAKKPWTILEYLVYYHDREILLMS